MRGIYAALLSILVLTSTILPLVDAADTVTTGDDSLSGTVVLDGNYTVSAGDTLTLAAGTTIDAKDYWILVEGSLVATDTIISSSTQGSGQGGASAGVWNGIIIAPEGDAVLDGVTISDARTCITVAGRLDANALTLSHCLVGMELYGTANLTGFSGNDLQSGGIRSTGTLNITDSSISNTSMAITSTDYLDVENLGITDSGAGIFVTSGSATIDNLNVVNLSMGLHVEAGVSGYMTGMTGERNVLAIDAGDSSNFPFQDISLGAERFLQAQNPGDISVTNAHINGSFNSERAAVDIISNGDISFTGISLTNVTHGIDISGAGDYTFNNLLITASGVGIQASGDLSLDIDTMVMEVEQTGMLLSEIQGKFTDSTINISAVGDNGVEILFGDYDIDNMEINKPYNSLEHNSIGVHSWLANSVTVSNQMKISGFATGLRLEDGKMTIDDLTAELSEDACIDLINGELIVTGLLSTSAAETGITLDEESTIVVASWASQYHTDGINIDESSTASIRAWTVFNTGASDATGSGTLYHSSIDDADIDVNLDASVLSETSITITDLSDVGIPAVVEVHGFTATAAGDGTITIPLTVAGSMVLATHQNVGASDSLSSGVSNQVLRVPIIPDGDWTISAGQSVVLNSPANGSSHVADGNITIEGGGSLFLQGSTLEMPTGTNLTITGSGVFGGDDATLAGGNVLATETWAITNTGSLTIEENLSWDSCNGLAETTGLTVVGNIEISGAMGCTVKINDGEVQGMVTVQPGSELQIHNSLEVTVLDKGEPVAGAIVNVNGNIANTDATGIVVYSIASRTVNSNGEQWAGRLSVSVNSGSLPEMFTWETNYSMDYQFMASTITPGPISEWTVLERAWSPYHLQGDLTIPSGETLTIRNGVHLRVFDGYSIIVEGTADVGSAVINSVGNSARWGGFEVGFDADTALYLTGTQIAEAAPGITMSGLSKITLESVLITRSGSSDPLIRTTAAASGTIDITDSELNQGGSGCVESQGAIILTMNSVELESCSGPALWAQGIETDIAGLVIGSGSSIGLDLTAVKGMVAGVNTSLHDGVSEAIKVNLAEELQLSDLNLSAPQDAALSITNSKNLAVNGLDILTSPGIEMDSTTGEFDAMVIDCGGSGTAISVTSLRTSGALSFTDFAISSCDTGIEVTSVSDYNSVVTFRDLEIMATIALSVDGADVYVERGTFNGELQCANATIDLVDIEPTTTTATSGEVWLWNSHIIQAKLYGNVVSASFSVDNGNNWLTEFSGSSTEILIPYAIISSSGRSEYTTATFTINAEGASPMTQLMTVGPTTDDIITISLTGNLPPSVVILTPLNESDLMEGGYFVASAEISDDISPLENLIITWTLSDDTGVLVAEKSGMTANFTNLEPGTFLLTLSAEDQQGAANTTSVAIEVSLLDSDGDWIDTCNDATWFDSLVGYSCGPDVHDEDDDNDGYSDEQDQWPTDPCAALDTDNDGQPNTINCPEGYTSLLVEDQDDDNDGTPDVLEGAVSGQDEGSSAITLFLAIGVVVILAGIILSRMRKEE